MHEKCVLFVANEKNLTLRYKHVIYYLKKKPTFISWKSKIKLVIVIFNKNKSLIFLEKLLKVWIKQINLFQ